MRCLSYHTLKRHRTECLLVEAMAPLKAVEVVAEVRIGMKTDCDRFEWL